MEGLKKSFLVRGNNIVGFSDKNFSTAPIGTVLAYAGNEAPRGYLLANGASYKVADYPNLYAVIGNTYGGDSTNFNVPNLVDKFIQGSTTSGTEKEAGLPNITGEVGYLNAIDKGNYYEGINNKDGCFASSRNIRTYPEATRTAKGEADEIGETGIINFNASNSNSIYGNSNTVQPPALTMVYIIKAFHTNEGVDSGASDDVINYIDGEIAKKVDKSYVDDNFATMDKVKDGYAKIIKNNDTDTNDAMFIAYKNRDLFGVRIYKDDDSEHELKFSASGISYVKNGVTVWGTSVADVGVTTITPVNSNITGNIEYTVKNGICYVSMKNLMSTISSTNLLISTTMPKPSINCTASSVTAGGNIAMIYIDKNTTNLRGNFYTKNAKSDCSFSYPVAEN